MAVKKVYEPNVKANAAITQRKKLFIDIPIDATAQVRILPITSEDGMIFTRAENHFKLKDETPNRGLALACLQVHGTEESGTDCYLSKLSKVLLKHGDKAEKAIGTLIMASARWYIQVLKAEDTGQVDKEGSPVLKYTGPYLLGLPKTGTDGVNRVMNNLAKAKKPAFTNPKRGQDLFITHHPVSPWYTVDRSGVEQDINKIFPEWQEKMIDDVYSELGLKVYTPEEQKQVMQRSYGDQLDWAALAEQFGL